MAKVREINREGKLIGYTFYCPGCQHNHAIYTNYDGHPKWDFNGDIQKPKFNPSLLVTVRNHSDPKKRRCHSFIRDGKIQFLSDCTHNLADRTINMVDI